LPKSNRDGAPQFAKPCLKVPARMKKAKCWIIPEGIALPALRPASVPVVVASDVYGSSEDNNNMTRRELCGSALLYAVANVTRSSQVMHPLKGFEGTKFHAYSRCLPDYLSGLAHQAAETRNTALAKLVSPMAIQDRQKWARQTLWALIAPII
jgi:hypothetical protein